METAREAIEKFCDNVKRSLLEAIALGQPVTVDHKSDCERYEGLRETDAVFMGATYTIRYGRPAEEHQRQAARDKQALEERLVEG
jgi:hypothetical protein